MIPDPEASGTCVDALAVRITIAKGFIGTISLQSQYANQAFQSQIIHSFLLLLLLQNTVCGNSATEINVLTVAVVPV